MTHDYHLRNDYSTPPSDPSGSMAPHSATTGHSIGYPVGSDLDNMVYPVGHTNGIDPINSEHIHNIPYALPTNGMLPPDSMQEMLPEGSAAARKKSAVDSVWGNVKPRILLVEDDKVCARIGSKFLQAFECGVETARDGLEAVNKINNGQHNFDLILMDIIMPHLDGVSATVCIREIRPHIPIIAMTSNIRADDIDMYFRYGMNDVLPKPFTKEGMLRALEKHLPQFKKNAPFAPAPPLVGAPQGFVTPNTPLGLNMGHLAGAQSLKDETSPGKSPATATSWNSPNQLPGASPVTAGGFMPQGGYMTPTHPNSAGFPPMGGARPPRRGVEQLSAGPGGVGEEHPEKRQRMYQGQPPQQGGPGFAQ